MQTELCSKRSFWHRGLRQGVGRDLVLKRLEQLSKGESAVAWTIVGAAEEGKGLLGDWDAGQAEDGGRSQGWGRGRLDVAMSWYPLLASHGQQGAPKAWPAGHWGIWEDWAVGLPVLSVVGPSVDHQPALGLDSSVTWGYQHPLPSAAEALKKITVRRTQGLHNHRGLLG